MNFSGQFTKGFHLHTFHVIAERSIEGNSG